MAAIETPLVNVLASSSQAPASSEKDALISKLDALLEKYLNTLDEYQKAREQLSKQLSGGFLSLAQANFQNRSSSIHYGQDCYDERMQAIRKVSIGGDADDIALSISSSEEVQIEQDEALKGDEKAEEDAFGDKRADSAAEPRKNLDPIRWFGILVPPALRSAQGSFISAVEGPVPQLVQLAQDLRGQEIEIGRLRKQIKKS